MMGRSTSALRHIPSAIEQRRTRRCTRTARRQQQLILSAVATTVVGILVLLVGSAAASFGTTTTIGSVRSGNSRATASAYVPQRTTITGGGGGGGRGGCFTRSVPQRSGGLVSPSSSSALHMVGPRRKQRRRGGNNNNGSKGFGKSRQQQQPHRQRHADTPQRGEEAASIFMKNNAGGGGGGGSESTENKNLYRENKFPKVSIPFGFGTSTTDGGENGEGGERFATTDPKQQENDGPAAVDAISNFISSARGIHDAHVPQIRAALRPSPLVSATPEWKTLQRHSEVIKEKTHLRDLLLDKERSDQLYASYDGVYYDYSRHRVTLETMDLLEELATKQQLKQRIQSMMLGEKINFTEDRAVLHTALRASQTQIGTVIVDGVDAIQEVHDVLNQIKQFTNDFRTGTIRGYTGKRLRNIISVGIGGSYLGPEFLHECLKTDPEGVNAALGYTLRFLANIDPVDVERACADLDPEETLILVVSKTFTTAETLLNARTMRQWLWDFMGDDKEVVRKHFAACASTSSIDKVIEFGIDADNYLFRFWDWVGGRYSVCSAVGAVPISLQYGFELFEKFLQGAKSIDDHFLTAPFHKNIPILMGMLGVWNMSFMGYKARAALPYAEALLKLPAHIQQLDMESNGKSVTKYGIEVDYNVGEVDFGEPGTNGQHSFYQLLHMGQTIPCDFIGFVKSQHDVCIDGEELSSHDELMANFFAQPDALAKGKTMDEVRAEGVPEELVLHKTFSGNRPSSSLLLPQLTAYATGQLLALYEHRTAVQGFIWDINSFDQWGVELGKKLALDIKTHIHGARQQSGGGGDGEQEVVDAGNPATTRILQYYIENSPDGGCDNVSVGGATSIKRITQPGHCPPSSHNLMGDVGKL